MPDNKPSTEPVAGVSAAVGDDLVHAALRAADALGKDVADVPVIAIAREAGLSRSTLIRRLGGTRANLDAAVAAVAAATAQAVEPARAAEDAVEERPLRRGL